jgi:hypothetical protein
VRHADQILHQRRHIADDFVVDALQQPGCPFASDAPRLVDVAGTPSLDGAGRFVEAESGGDGERIVHDSVTVLKR